jgi:hypothetical protein
MGKDLRTNASLLRLHKYTTLDGTAWGFKTMQPFFPPLELLFKTSNVSGLCHYGIRLTDENQKIIDDTHIIVKGKPLEIHRKTTMILSPFKWMRGDYGTFGLPKPEDVAKDIQDKVQSPHTAGYVGALASIVLSESECVHFPKVYGVYVGIAEKHTVDISDDYEELSERYWFSGNLGKLFDLKLRTPEPIAEFTHTRSQRASVLLGEDGYLDDIEEVHPGHVSTPSVRSMSHSDTGETTEYEEDEEESDSEDAYDIQSCECSDDEEEEGLDDENEDEPFAWATFKDVPVITTIMETCEGTYYDLLKAHSEPEKHTAWVMQLTFALAYAQRNFGFTHNDLHGNNVMYIHTDKEHLYYKHSGTCYKVPTYGYLIKIIDFDRAAFSVRLSGMKEPRLFVSGQFQINEEAAGQYNVEPFFSQTHPRIPLNPSFDLCRFASSMFWDMFPEGPTHSYDHPLFGFFKQWMTQSDGTSVLFRTAHPDRHDRYHGFDLYKAIARYCKDSAVPKRELGKFLGFQVASIPIGFPCLYIEA